MTLAEVTVALAPPTVTVGRVVTGEACAGTWLGVRAGLVAPPPVQYRVIVSPGVAGAEVTTGLPLAWNATANLPSEVSNCGALAWTVMGICALIPAGFLTCTCTV